MLTFKEQVRSKVRSLRAPKSEDGVALIAVMIVMLMLLMSTILITATVMSTQGQTKTFNIYQQARSTADSGMSSFLASVNTSRGHTMLETYKTGSAQGSTAQRVTPTNALCKTVESTVNTQVGYFPRWCVWTVKVSSGTGTSGYYIYSKGFTVPTQSSTARSNASDEVVIRVFIEPMVVDTTTSLDDGKVVYRMPATAPFQLGITGQVSVNVVNGGAIYSNQFSRNSAPTGTSTNFVSIASDDLITLPSNFVTSTLTAPASKSVTEICRPTGSTACSDPIHRLSPISADMTGITAFVNAACPNAANTYPDWVASANPANSTIPAGCYNTVTIDRDMPITAAYSAQMPLNVNVKGAVYIRDANIGLNRDPAAFQLRAIGSVVWGNSSGATANFNLQRHTNAYIASAASCASNNETTRKIYINGALACGTVNIGANTIVYMDTKSQQYGVDIVAGAPANSIWFATAIEQL